MSEGPIGILDSGIGGLSVISEFRSLCPFEDILFFADTQNYPYGTKSRNAVEACSWNAFDWLNQKGAKALLCACSTASCVAVPHFKDKLPIELVGMLNAELIDETRRLKQNGQVGVIATELSVSSRAFEFLFRQSPWDIQSFAASQLVERISGGDFQTPVLTQVIQKALMNFNLKTLGCLVVGCTHFYHVTELLKELLGPVPLIEPARVAAKVLERRLKEKKLLSMEREKKGKTICVVTGELEPFFDKVTKIQNFKNQKYIDEFISIRDFETCKINSLAS